MGKREPRKAQTTKKTPRRQRRDGRSVAIQPPLTPGPEPLGMMEALRADAAEVQQARLAQLRQRWGWAQAVGRLIANIVLFTLALSPAFVTARLITAHAVNTPFGDDWSLVDQLESLHLDHLEWRELCQPIDGERSPLPQILHLAALRLTGGDLRADAWMNFTWMSLTSLGLLLLLLRTAGGGFGAAVIYFLTNLALFSPAQNLFAMRQAGILLPVACLVWTHLIASFHCSTVLKFAACTLLTATAAANGVYGLSLLLTVPVLACFTVGLPCRLRPWIFTSAWICFAALLLRTYFLGWPLLPPSPTPTTPDIEATSGLETGFVLASKLIASPLTAGWWTPPPLRIAVGVALAAMLLGMAAWTLIATIGRQEHRSGSSCAPWLLLGIGGLLGISLLTTARLSATPMSQVTGHPGLLSGQIALPVLMGTFVPFYIQVREWHRKLSSARLRFLPPSLLLVLFTVIFASQITSWLHGWEATASEHQARLRSRVALHLCRIFPPRDPTAFGTNDLVMITRRAQFLHNEGYLSPLLLHDSFWPDRRVFSSPLSLFEGRVTTVASPEGTRVFRVVARLPSSTPRKPNPPAGVVLAHQNPLDPTQHRLLSVATPDPADHSAWMISPPPELPKNTKVEFWAIDGSSLLAYRLVQILTPDGELERSEPSASKSD